MIGLIHRHFRFEDSLYSLSGLLSWVRLTNQCIDEANFISAYTIKRARTLKISPNKINFDIKKRVGRRGVASRRIVRFGIGIGMG